jgi:hypothetical protein
VAFFKTRPLLKRALSVIHDNHPVSSNACSDFYIKTFATI